MPLPDSHQVTGLQGAPHTLRTKQTRKPARARDNLVGPKEGLLGCRRLGITQEARVLRNSGRFCGSQTQHIERRGDTRKATCSGRGAELLKDVMREVWKTCSVHASQGGWVVEMRRSLSLGTEPRCGPCALSRQTPATRAGDLRTGGWLGCPHGPRVAFLAKGGAPKLPGAAFHGVFSPLLDCFIRAHRGALVQFSPSPTPPVPCLFAPKPTQFCL